MDSNFTKNLYDFDSIADKSKGGAIHTSAFTTIRNSYFAENGAAIVGQSTLLEKNPIQIHYSLETLYLMRTWL